MPDINRIDNGGGPQEWFQALPIITRYWFGTTLLLTLAGNLGVVSPMNFAFAWSNIMEKFEIWRFATCFCYAGPFEIGTLITLYLQVSFSSQYETGGPFNTGAGGGTADYVFMLMLGAVAAILFKPLFTMFGIYTGHIFCRNMIFYVFYVWSKRHPTANGNIWGVPLKAVYMPFAYVVLSIFLGAPWMYMVHGILLGHIYYFLADIVPQVYGRDILQTPQFLLDQFGVGMYLGGPAEDNRPPQQQDHNRRNRFGGHNWGGGGQRLGSDTPDAAPPGPPPPTPPPQRAFRQNQPAAAAGGGGGQQQPQRNRGHNWGGGQRLGSS
mmetsp:Transcript_34087/g.78615  ORF Transcript_34087/g.78615 Transcript_34087/m.78615 type:complete len:323 (-) Transcript_34087:537-1505(-)